MQHDNLMTLLAYNYKHVFLKFAACLGDIATRSRLGGVPLCHMSLILLQWWAGQPTTCLIMAAVQKGQPQCRSTFSASACVMSVNIPLDLGKTSHMAKLTVKARKVSCAFCSRKFKVTRQRAWIQGGEKNWGQ